MFKHTGRVEAPGIFERLAPKWWDESGPHALLHQMNAVRLSFILEALAPVLAAQTHTDAQIQAKQEADIPKRDHKGVGIRFLDAVPLKGLRILDVGCGGGLLSEPLARLGATVVGLDTSPEGVAVAQEHAKRMGLDITYHCIKIEDYVMEAEPFDCVIGSEVVEHVSDVQGFLKACSLLLAPKGRLVLSTLNRTWQSYLLAILGAEHVLRWVPKGTHDWRAFLKPSEIARILEPLGLKLTALSGLRLGPLTSEWKRGGTPTMNYILAASHSSFT